MSFRVLCRPSLMAHRAVEFFIRVISGQKRRVSDYYRSSRADPVARTTHCAWGALSVLILSTTAHTYAARDKFFALDS